MPERLLAVGGVFGQILGERGGLLGRGRAGEDAVEEFVGDGRGFLQCGDAGEEIAGTRLERPEHEVVVPQEERGAEGRVDTEFGFLGSVGEGVEKGFLEIFLRVLFAFDAFPAFAGDDAFVLADGGDEGAGELLGGERAFLRDGEKFLGRILRVRGEQARALIGLREREFADEPAEVEFVRGDFLREQVEEFGGPLADVSRALAALAAARKR